MERRGVRPAALAALALLLALAMTVARAVPTFAEAAATPALGMDDVSVDPGTTFTLDVKIADNPGIIAGTWEIAYDSPLMLMGIDKGEAFAELGITKPPTLDSGCRVVWDAVLVEDKDIHDGTTLTLSFSVSEDVPVGTRCSVSVAPAVIDGKADVMDNDLNEVDLQPASCIVYVGVPVPVVTNISGATVTVDPVADLTYTDAPVEPAVTVTLNGEALDGTADYDVTYADNVEAGEATVTVTGKGAYEGEVTGGFVVARRPLTVTALTQTVAYGQAVAAGVDQVSAEGLVEGHALTAVTLSASREDAGEGTIAPSDAVVGGPGLVPVTDNYEVAYVAGALTVTKADSHVGEVMATDVRDNLDASVVVLTRSDETVAGTLALVETTLAYGTKTYHWTFVPDDEVNYEGASGTVEVSVTGHDWGEPTYGWEQDLSGATATRTCANDASHVEIETVPVEVEVVRPAACEAVGEARYVVVFANDAFARQERTGELAALGHDWGAWEVVTPATYDTAGLERRSCSRCDATEERELAPLRRTDISDAAVVIEGGPFAYIGTAVEPAVTVTLNGEALDGTADYDVTYADNVEAGEATVTVTGKNDYRGTAVGHFVIGKAVNPVSIIPAATVTRGGNDVALAHGVTGAVGTVTFAISGDALGCALDPDGTLTSGNVVGTVSVVVTVAGDGNRLGATAEILVSVTDKASVVLDVAQAGTTFGSGLAAPVFELPVVGDAIVSYSGTTRAGATYGPSSVAPTDAGAYVVTVMFETGDTVYLGTDDFVIAAADIAGTSVASPADARWTGKAITPEPELIFDGVALAPDVDYTLGWEGNVAPGTAAVIVTGIGNFDGTLRLPFMIHPVLVDRINLALHAGFDSTTLTALGAALKFDATIVPAEVTTPGVTWVSSNPSVATVDTAGVVHAVASGTTSITAASKDGSGVVSEPCVVTVDVAELATLDPVAADGYTPIAKVVATALDVDGEPLALEEGEDVPSGAVVRVEARLVAGYTFRGWRAFRQSDGVDVTSLLHIVSSLADALATASAESGSETGYFVMPDYPVVVTADLAVTSDLIDLATCTVTLDEASFAYDGTVPHPIVSVTAPNGTVLDEGDDFVIDYPEDPSVGVKRVAVHSTEQGRCIGSTAVEYEVVASIPHIFYRTHVQNVGWEAGENDAWPTDGDEAGTQGRRLRLEGIEIKVDGAVWKGHVEYQAHVQNVGWESEWARDGATSGTQGQRLRLEAIRIRLTDDLAEHYDVWYSVHAQNVGWLGWTKNGVSAGTAGHGWRLEAIRIKILPKGAEAPGATTDAFRDEVRYSTHVQNVGWQATVGNGVAAGTSGKRLRLEGLRVSIGDLGVAGGIEYQAHVQNVGWESEWARDGATSGSTGHGRRLEAVRIRLYGDLAERYDVWYCVHAQNVGWMGWTLNGDDAGTHGRRLRLEAIKVCLVPKGGPAPGPTEGAYL